MREIFDNGQDFTAAVEMRDMSDRAHVKFVGTITDIIRRTSRNGNKYARITLQDESGMVNGLFLDSARDQRLSNYLESGKKLPKKADIIIIHGTLGDDVVFIDKIFPLKDKIYMKLSDVK